MILHPDRNEGCEEKSKQLKDVIEAYTVLSGEF